MAEVIELLFFDTFAHENSEVRLKYFEVKLPTRKFHNFYINRN